MTRVAPPRPAGTGDGPDADRISLRPGDLRETAARDWLIRFGFGAAVSTLAGLVSALAGPRVGGVFLAFPAILLASLTLIAKEDGAAQARNDARGAVFGTLGLVAFAAVLVLTAHRWPLWAALGAAGLMWTVVALGGYLVSRAVGAGGDEPPPRDGG